MIQRDQSWGMAPLVEVERMTSGNLLKRGSLKARRLKLGLGIFGARHRQEGEPGLGLEERRLKAGTGQWGLGEQCLEARWESAWLGNFYFD